MIRPLKPIPMLSEPDAQVWAEATKAARPLKNRARAAPLPRVQAIVVPGEILPTFSGKANARSPMNATLDATWDRKIRTGEVAPDMIIDLHGHSQAQAFQKLQRGLLKAATRRARLVLVITGKGDPDPATWPAPDPRRGMLRQAFPGWLDAAEIAPHISSVRPAHARHGGAGAWYVILKRPR